MVFRRPGRRVAAEDVPDGKRGLALEAGTKVAIEELESRAPW